MYLITILTYNDSANIFPDIYTCLCRRQCLIFIRALQMLSGFSLGMKVLLSVIYWMVAFSLVIAMLTRHIDMPVLLSKSMFHIGSAWLVFTLYIDFCLIDSRCDEVVCTIAESRFLLCVGSYLLSAYPADYLCGDLLSE